MELDRSEPRKSRRVWANIVMAIDRLHAPYNFRVRNVAQPRRLNGWIAGARAQASELPGPRDVHKPARSREQKCEAATMVAEGGAVGEMVREGIRKAREKLIDLGLRNGMLNYRHSETSARHLRVVAVDPAALVASLDSEERLDIVPVPPVETIPRDEDTEEFRAALREAKVVDPEWLAAEDARRAAGNRRRNRDKAAERALRDRVRLQLRMPEWRAATDPKARAVELGIDPSYDLPVRRRSSEPDRRPELQTLFFPDHLESKLSAIYGGARTLQEDAGISALSCAVGFLEWYETEEQSESQLRSNTAPPHQHGKAGCRRRVGVLNRRTR